MRTENQRSALKCIISLELFSRRFFKQRGLTEGQGLFAIVAYSEPGLALGSSVPHGLCSQQ